MALALEAIEFAVMLPGAASFSDQNISAVWKGPIQTHSGQTVAFTKLPSANQLIAEIACAILGRALSLNIPRPYLLEVPPPVLNSLPGITVPPAAAASGAIGVAFEDGQHPSLRRWFNGSWSQDHQRLLAAYRSWKELCETAVFDEWIANVDRNIGNVLYDGAGSFVLIDHAHALTGPHWNAAALVDPAINVKNLLVEDMGKVLTLPERHQWCKEANTQAHRYQGIDFNLLAANCRMDLYASSSEANAACDFLRERVQRVVGLVSSKLGFAGVVP